MQDNDSSRGMFDYPTALPPLPGSSAEVGGGEVASFPPIGIQINVMPEGRRIDEPVRLQCSTPGCAGGKIRIASLRRSHFGADGESSHTG